MAPATAQVTEAVLPPTSQIEEGILNIPHIFLKSKSSFELSSKVLLLFVQ